MTTRFPDAIGQILDAVHSRERFLIVGHRSPDGDSLCSQLALAECLEALGKFALPVSADQPLERFSSVPGIEKLVVARQVPDDFDAVFLLECSDYERSGVSGLHRFFTINIDHHMQNSMFAAINWVDPGASAVGEMLYSLATAMGVPITTSLAENLFTAIVTDTGSFRFPNTTRRTFLVCADLLATGISPSEIVARLYDNEPLAKVRMLAKVLLALEIDAAGTIAWFSLDREEVARCQSERIDTDGFVDFTRTIEGLRVVIFLREIEPGVFKASLRSKDDTNVAEAARLFGGGGHRNASGCVIAGSRDQALNRLLDAVRGQMRPVPTQAPS